MCRGDPETGLRLIGYIEKTGDEDMEWASITGAVRKWRERDRERRALQTMSDRDLADIGLVRSDIEAVVRGNYGRSR